MGVYFPTHLATQEVYTQLRQEKHIQIFTEASNSLVCQCGCNFLLSICPHVECPWGIPARRFIEACIIAGYSSQEIVDGFRNGFGSSLHKDVSLQELLAKGHIEPAMLQDLVKGYGAKVASKHSLLVPILFITLIALTSALLIVRWYRRNFKKK